MVLKFQTEGKYRTRYLTIDTTYQRYLLDVESDDAQETSKETFLYLLNNLEKNKCGQK